MTDLSAEVHAIAREFAPLAEARGMTVEVRAQPGLTLPMEPGTLRQVLLNLLDNAVKYGPAGQRITVRLRGDAAGIQLVVDDQGSGVAVADRESVWEAYERGSQPGRTAVAGSGIGLTVVRELVQRHGGTAGVEDAPTGGARFVVRLPVGTPA